MAGWVKETISLAAATGGGNQTFTFSAAMGTPKGAIFRVTKQVTDQDGSAADAVFSEGYTDGTNQFCATSQGDDAAAREDTDSMQSSSEVIRILTPGGVIDGEANFNSFGTNTVVITWGNAPSGAYLITCTAYGGDDISCVAGSTAIATVLNNTATITDSQERDLLHVASTGNATMDSALDDFNISVGCAHFTSGAITQACSAYLQDEFSNSGDPAAIVRDNRVAHDFSSNGAVDWALEITAQTTTTITITTRDAGASGGTTVGWLSVKLGGATQGDRCAVGNITSPVASGNWSSTAPGFKPQHVEIGLTDTPTVNVASASVAEGGTWGISAVDAINEFCQSITDEDGAGTTNCRSHFRGRAIWLRDDTDTATLYDLSFSSFDANGWTYSQVGTPSATAKQWWYVAIEEEAVAGASIIGAVTVSLSPAAVLDFQQHPAIAGAVTLALSPAAALDFEQHPAIAGDVPLALNPAATLDFTGAASIVGEVTQALTPGAVLDFQQHPAIAGEVTQTLTPGAVLDFQQHPAIAGDVPLALNPAAVLDFQQHPAISGDVTQTLTPGAALDFQQHPAIAGDVPLALSPAATLAFSGSSQIVGDVTQSLTPGAVLDHQQHPAVLGAGALALTPAALLAFGQSAQILGDVPLALTPAAAMEHQSHAAIAGDGRIQLTPAAALAFTAGTAIAGDGRVQLTPGALLDVTRHPALTGDGRIVLSPAAILNAAPAEAPGDVPLITARGPGATARSGGPGVTPSSKP